MYNQDGFQLRVAWATSAVMVALSSVLIVSCKFEDDKTSTGTLVVPFQLGAGKSCEEVGISRVKVTLDEDAYEKEVDCSKGKVRFEEVKIGLYTVKAYGFDAEGVAIMDSDARENIKVLTDSVVELDDPMVLSDAPASIKIRWDLGYGNCKIWKIDQFRVKLWNDDGNKLLLETKLACTSNVVDDDAYRTVEDPDRKIDGDTVGTLQVEPIDARGNAIGSGDSAKYTFDSPGPGGVVKISVSCNSDGCQGSGTADNQ
jgi:hypothetical protein